MPTIEAELDLLRAENRMLKATLAAHGIAPSPQAAESAAQYVAPPSTPSTLPPGAKIKLFRKLFHGREDVYPIRWEGQQSGKAGYSPVCANEWRKGVCEKPRIKCADCRHSLYVPVTDNVIESHLRGNITAGVYPLLADDRCYFLAIAS